MKTKTTIMERGKIVKMLWDYHFDMIANNEPDGQVEITLKCASELEQALKEDAKKRYKEAINYINAQLEDDDEPHVNQKGYVGGALEIASGHQPESK